MAHRPNLLVLTHRVPFPPDRGDRIRSFHVLKYLSARANVYLAALADEPVDQRSAAALDELTARWTAIPVHRLSRWLHAAASMARGQSATQGLFVSQELASTIDRWSAEIAFDAVLAYCSGMAQYALRSGLHQAQQIIDLVDVDSQKWFDYASRTTFPLSWLYACEGRRLRRFERTLPTHFEAVTLVTQAEADLYTSFCPNHRTHVIANGVDLEYFASGTGNGSGGTGNGSGGTGWSPRDAVHTADRHRRPASENCNSVVDPNAPGGTGRPPRDVVHTADRHRRPASVNCESGLNSHAVPDETALPDSAATYTCVFLGALDYRPNVDGLSWFCAQVWPRVLRRLPSARLAIVGRRPVPAVRRLGRLSGVDLIGGVADVRPYLSAARISIAPLRIARGVQNKVLESMAMGRAVLASRGALEGLSVEPGVHVLEANEPDEWVWRIEELMADDVLCRSLGAAARRYVEQHHCWESTLAPLGELLPTSHQSHAALSSASS